MPDFWKTFLEFVRGVLKLLDDKLSSISPDASAIILLVVAVGLLGLLFLIALRALPDRQPLPARTKIEGIDEAEPGPRTVTRFKKIIDDLNEDIDRRDTTIKNLQDNREHNSVERLYFAVNGIVNSEFILGIGLILWEFFDLRNRSPRQTVSVAAVAHELGRVMSVLAATMICSVVIVYITRSVDGRSYQKINRAFFISLGIATAAFVVFTLLAPEPFQ